MTKELRAIQKKEAELLQEAADIKKKKMSIDLEIAELQKKRESEQLESERKKRKIEAQKDDMMLQMCKKEFQLKMGFDYQVVTSDELVELFHLFVYLCIS